ncbi:hypothetical protein [Larkinella terrae]|uniref:Uncharacterized protein n=1 Tax=Larkinella terrae TaxID=2025311 RepID=A0A7K0EIT8_9BACT|nr:hypothetical protein [Larkinella terrae]MRS61759.1 hypothetical protein [Larkinella terrae]
MTDTTQPTPALIAQKAKKPDLFIDIERPKFGTEKYSASISIGNLQGKGDTPTLALKDLKAKAKQLIKKLENIEQMEMYHRQDVFESKMVPGFYGTSHAMSIQTKRKKYERKRPF